MKKIFWQGNSYIQKKTQKTSLQDLRLAQERFKAIARTS